MAHSIKVNADVSGVRKELLALSKDLEKSVSGTRKIQLFDRETRAFIEKGAKDAISNLRKEVLKLEDANNGILDSLKAQNLKEEEMKKRQNDLIRNKRKILEIEKEVLKTQRASDDVMGQTSKMGQFKGGFKGSFKGVGSILSKIPGVGGLLQGAMGGVGMMGMLGGAAGAGLMGLGGLAIGRGITGFNTFDGNKDSMIKMMGRGFSRGEASNRDPRAQALGLSAEEVRNLRLQATDAFGRKGAGMDSILGIQKSARGLGIDASSMIGAGQGLRAQLGLTGGQKTFAKLQATLISTELEGSVGPFLETTAHMLTNINEHGIGLDSAALAVMSSFANSKGLSPEMTQRIFSNLDDAVRGATGENASFYMSALTSSGIGANSLGGAQLAMSQGLFGGDAEKLRGRGLIPASELDELQKQGIISDDSKNGVGAFQKRAGGISNMFGKITSGMGASGKALVASKLTGIKDPLAAREAMGLLQKAATGPLGEKDKKRLTELSKSPEEQMNSRLQEIADSAAGQLEASQKFKADMSEALGERLAPLGTVTNQLLGNMDRALTYIANFFGAGIETAQEGFAKRVGEGGATLDEYKGMSPDEQKSVRASLQKELEASSMREQYAGSAMGRFTGMMAGQPIIGGGRENLWNLDSKKEAAEQNRILEYLAAIAGHTATTARQANKPKNTSIQGSAKTRSK